MKRTLLSFLLMLLGGGVLLPQSTPPQVAAILDQEIDRPEVISYLLQKYLVASSPQLPAPTGAEEWTAEANNIRKHLLDDVIFHGWPKAWVDSSPRFEDMGTIPSGKGYTMRKLRYEVVPGFWSTAILYEPENLHRKVPAILNVNGHVGPEGKSVEYKQKRCINFALQGIIALSLEWLGQGELSAEENQHWYAGHLDLVGANGEGLFYLEMRRGLDYLCGLPHVDGNRIGMTGLSGGGWQTMLLSALDERVKVAVPVAGYDALAEWLPRLPGTAGDNEQAGTDTFKGQDCATLTAMRAPSPTLLINNADDDCCFRAAIVRPYIYDAIKPFFALYGKADYLRFHVNTDPSTHNYQLDNRLHAYQFFSQHFNMPKVENEIPVDAQIKSYKELEVGLPKDNLTILTLARKLAGEIERQPVPPKGLERTKWAAFKRKQLAEVVRYKAVTISHAWAVSSTNNKGVESLGYRFELSNSTPATGFWVKAIKTLGNAPITIVLSDKGKKSAANDVVNRVNRGEQVLALDLLFTGDDSTEGLPNTWAYPEMLAAAGERPLGMEVAQLLAIAHWIEERAGTHQIRLESRGIRTQTVALAASAIEPDFLSEVVIYDGMRTLDYLLGAPVHYQDAPDLFCLDLYKRFDLSDLTTLAGTTQVSYGNYVAEPSK